MTAYVHIYEMKRIRQIILFIICLNYIEASKNVILILADDLDLILDGMTPLTNTVNLIGNMGVTYENAFVASPICCPNRASILTGKYMHNHLVYNNSIEGNCNSLFWQNQMENSTFASIIKSRSNFKTFYAGKYMNKYGSKKVGDVSHVPPGWDWWYGLVGNSKYYNYTLSINGTKKSYGEKEEDYLTDVISQFAKDFLLKQTNEDRFLMVLAPPAPHSPFIPAKRHSDKYKNVTAKRTANFNKLLHKEKKHWLLRMEPTPLPNKYIKLLDEVYRKRWETLLAVDDLVMNIYQTLIKRNILNDTYIIFSSDNGYHIGQFGLTIDKRQPYETDIKVPFLMRGPNINPSKTFSPISSVDIFATILDIVGIVHPSDGTSLLRDLANDRTLLVEYKGEKSDGKPIENCPFDNDPNLTLCSSEFACKCQDSANNTYSCIRRVSDNFNNIFCQFEDDENFMELYNLNIDSDQLNNIAQKVRKEIRYKYRKRLRRLMKCKNKTCMF